MVIAPRGVHFKLTAAIGSLMYGMIHTRPDLACPVGLVKRFMYDPIKENLKAVKWVLRYVRGSLGL